MTRAEEAGTRDLHKFPNHASCCLVQVVFSFKLLALNRMQLYSAQQTCMTTAKIVRFDWLVVFCWRCLSYL